MWLFDEVLEKYSYNVEVSVDEDKCFKGLYIDIKVKPKYRIDPKDDYEINYVAIEREEIVDCLKPLIKKHIKDLLKKFYPKI